VEKNPQAAIALDVSCSIIYVYSISLNLNANIMKRVTYYRRALHSQHNLVFVFKFDQCNLFWRYI
jgi:hypothetical protein